MKCEQALRAAKARPGKVGARLPDWPAGLCYSVHPKWGYWVPWGFEGLRKSGILLTPYDVLDFDWEVIELEGDDDKADD